MENRTNKTLHPLERKKITIYHGSKNGTIEHFSLDYSRSEVDFGKGVYFTTKKQQAIDWALRGVAKGFVYTCELDLTGLDLLQYEKISDDYVEIIHLCRIGLEDIAAEVVEGFETADAIYGLLVDGRMHGLKELANKYNEGDSTFEEFFNQLDAILYGSNKDQLCIKTDIGLNRVSIRDVAEFSRKER